MFDAELWASTEADVQSLPGGTAMCERVGRGTSPWPEIGKAMAYCTWFPTAEFKGLLASGDFDVRWPLTFAAWYRGSSGASVDRACAEFLSATGLWEQALEVLPEYTDPEWLSGWRSMLEQYCRTSDGKQRGGT